MFWSDCFCNRRAAFRSVLHRLRSTQVPLLPPRIWPSLPVSAARPANFAGVPRPAEFDRVAPLWSFPSDFRRLS